MACCRTGHFNHKYLRFQIYTAIYTFIYISLTVTYLFFWVNDVYGGRVARENTVRFCFQRFRSVNFEELLQNEPRGRLETQINNEKY